MSDSGYQMPEQPAPLPPKQQPLPQQPPQRFPGQGMRQTPLQQMLNESDMRALKECRRESFYSRCLPFSCLLLGVANTGRNPETGAFMLKPNVRRSIVAVVTGFILGKLSYQRQCYAKLMALEDGNFRRLAMGQEVIAPGRQPPSDEATSSEEDLMLPAFQSSRRISSDDYHDSDIDSDKNIQSKGLDPEFMPNIDRATEKSREGDDLRSAASRRTSYEELRRLNREDFERKQLAGRGPGPAPAPNRDGYYAPPTTVSKSAPQPEGKPSRPVRRNAYGDIIEE